MSKDRFLKAFSNMPADERNEIIVLIDDKPYTWNRAYDEIESRTELGNRILKKLENMGII